MIVAYSQGFNYALVYTGTTILFSRSS